MGDEIKKVKKCCLFVSDCQGVDVVHADNIDSFKGCTIIEGSITILDISFNGFQQVYPKWDILRLYSDFNKFLHLRPPQGELKIIDFFGCLQESQSKFSLKLGYQAAKYDQNYKLYPSYITADKQGISMNFVEKVGEGEDPYLYTLYWDTPRSIWTVPFFSVKDSPNLIIHFVQKP